MARTWNTAVSFHGRGDVLAAERWASLALRVLEHLGSLKAVYEGTAAAEREPGGPRAQPPGLLAVAQIVCWACTAKSLPSRPAAARAWTEARAGNAVGGARATHAPPTGGACRRLMALARMLLVTERPVGRLVHQQLDLLLRLVRLHFK